VLRASAPALRLPGGRLFSLERPIVMGILNTTPDSFFAGSRATAEADILQRAEKMLKEGAAILDIGGASTRPGASDVPEAQEATRVLPAVEAVARTFQDAVISVDTWRASIAREAVQRGAHIVNDVGSGRWDDAMIPAVAALRVPYIAMHSRGKPAAVQQAPHYTDVLTEVWDELADTLHRCTAAGVHDVVLDPGFGFAKLPAHNFALLRNLESLLTLGKPLLVGVSRKGMVHRTLGISAEEALNGSTVLHAIALMNGASILRVHDVREAVEAVRLVEAVQGA